jgi:Putative beta-barrel porin-2, OmpL-like. bbp2
MRRAMLGTRRSLLALAPWLALPLALTARSARADSPSPPPAGVAAPAPAPVAPAPAAPAAPAPAAPTKGPTYSINGYVEAAYTYDFEKPSNGIINYRGFDDRHNTFTLQNAVIDASGSIVGLSARIALQVGSTPSTYYASEPSLPGTSGAASSSADDWKYIQQAYGGYKFSHVANGLTLEGGIFLSPIGPESMAAKDSWNYSRSNLFFGLPFYHTGLRATLEATERTTVAVWVVNGWNSVVDNNPYKSVLAQYTYKVPDRLLLSVLYMGGVERSTGAPEGQPWRHLADVYAQLDVSSVLSFLTEVDAGVEPNHFGVSYWGAAALYARVHPVSWLYVAARGDRFTEHRGSGSAGTASPIFFPASWVSSGTFTVEGRPHDNVALRVEYRHDQASSDIYFAGTVKGDGVKTPYLPNALAQNTITAAALAWF